MRIDVIAGAPVGSDMRLMRGSPSRQDLVRWMAGIAGGTLLAGGMVLMALLATPSPAGAQFAPGCAQLFGSQHCAVSAFNTPFGLPYPGLSAVQLPGGPAPHRGAQHFPVSAEATGTVVVVFLSGLERSVVMESRATPFAPGIWSATAPNLALEQARRLAEGPASLGTSTAYQDSALPNSSITSPTAAMLRCGSDECAAGSGWQDADASQGQPDAGDERNYRDATDMAATEEIDTPTATTTPEPGTISLIALGLIGVVGARYWRFRRS